MRTRYIFTAALAALALSGCSVASAEGGDVEHASTAVAAAENTTAPSSRTPLAQTNAATTSPIPAGQEWADEKVNAWVENSSVKSVKGFLYPFNLINSWNSPESGHIRLVIDNSYQFNKDGTAQRYETARDELRIMGLIMFESIGDDSPELETVTVTTEDGTRTGSFSRSRTGADPSDLDAWADEKYVQWLDAMNDAYESFCGTTIEKLEDYRNCLPADPHAYVESVEAPAEGELLVTLSPGPWQGNTYDTDSMRGVDFVAGNMIIKINKKAFTTEQVETLTVVVDGEEESGVAKREDWGY
ncbi:hypothetical protein [Arthrobacter sp. JSM 101049]|uniref:hypothetical protein n=1 Tax=Arthrobacter sp. JSM 101049 TaxID=929097 RepID=UPI003564EAD1